MPTHRELRERFATRVVPLHVPRQGKRTEPFVVVYDTGDTHPAGRRIGIDAFHEMLDDYDAVIVHWHPEGGVERTGSCCTARHGRRSTRTAWNRSGHGSNP